MSCMKWLRRASIAALGLCAATTAASAQTTRISMATPWAGGHWFESAKGFASLVNNLTENRVRIDVYPAGTLGSALKVTETVQKGIAQAGHNWAGYDWAIDRTGVLLASWAGGMTPEEYILWLYSDGGAELWKTWRQEKFDVVAVPCGVHEPDIFMHAHKPVKTLEDLKGLKLRTSGAWAEIAPKLGISTVILPGSEVFTALDRKVVDAVEFGGPSLNLTEGFHKIAKYVIMPGLHSPGGMYECIFNKSVWSKLSDRDRQMIEYAGRLTVMDTWINFAKSDFDAYKTMRESPNVEIVRVDAEVTKAAQVASRQWAEEQAGKNEWFKRVYEQQSAFLERMKLWPEFRFDVGRR